MRDLIVERIVTRPLWGVYGPAMRGLREILFGVDLALLVFLAVAVMLLASGAAMIWRAVRTRKEHATIRAQGEKPPPRNAPWGCVLAVGLPLAALGATILAFITWLLWAVALEVG